MHLKYKILLIVGVVVAVWLTSYFLVQNTEAYRSAVKYIEANSKVAEILGKVKSTGLSPFGFMIKFSSNSGRAYFRIKIIGEKDEAIAYLSLMQENEVWLIKRGKLNYGDKEEIDLLADQQNM